jgi:hypothetical protein
MRPGTWTHSPRAGLPLDSSSLRKKYRVRLPVLVHLVEQRKLSDRERAVLEEILKEQDA